MTNTLGQVEQLLHDLSPVISGAASVTWSAAREVVRADSVAYVLGCLQFDVAASVFAIMFFALRKKDHVAGGFYTFLIFVCSAVATISTVCMFDPWSWISIVHPDIGLAHKLMLKVIGS
jgi:hypothetical protein